MVDDDEDQEFTTAIQEVEKEETFNAKRQAVLLVMSGTTTGQTIFLESKDVWNLGRSAESDVVFHDASVSRNHCKISFQSEDHWLLEDLESSNGTWINGERTTKAQLKSGDKIQLGSSIIVKFVVQDELDAAFQRELYESATKDSLTAVFTKRHFLEHLDVEFNYHRRVKKPLSVVMCDIDHFKKVNDTYGHLAGDLVLREMGRLFLNVMRKGDMVGRYGGEEIVMSLRETPLPGARMFADRLRLLVETHPFVYEGQRIPVTVSLGVATSTGDNYKSVTELLKTADEFLYKAKQSGRNRVASLMDS